MFDRQPESNNGILRSHWLCGLAMMMFSLGAHAVWPVGIGGAGADEVVAVRTSPTGDTYTAGLFSGTLEIGDETLISQGGRDIFLVRISPAGQVEWARSAGGPFDETLKDITLDTADSIYLVGEFLDTASFGASDIFSLGSRDGYIAKINNQGDWNWVRGMGGADLDEANDVVTLEGDSSVIPPVPESVVVAGSYECEAEFGDDITLDNGNCLLDGRDLYVARLRTSNGDFIWATDRGNNASGTERIDHLAIDDQGRLYATGSRLGSESATLLDDTFENLDNWTSVTPGNDFHQHFNNTALDIRNDDLPHLAFRGEPGVLWSPAWDTSDKQRIFITADFMHGYEYESDGGNSDVSEYPEEDDDYIILEYFDIQYGWLPLVVLEGGQSPKQVFSWGDTNPIILSHPSAPFNGDFGNAVVLALEGAFHSSFRLRLRHLTNSGNSADHYDWWYVDNFNVKAPDLDSEPFFMEISNVLDESAPSLSGGTDLPTQLDINDIEYDGSGASGSLVLAGQHSGTMVFGGCGTVTGTGAYVASISTDGACQWSKSIPGVDADGVTVDNQGNVHFTGSFSGTVTFNNDPGGTLSSAGGTDVYIASLDTDGEWRWVTGGDYFNEGPGIPAYAGGTLDDAGYDISTDGVGSLYVGGSFRAVASFGPSDTLTSAGADDGFVINLGTDGRFFQEANWTVGVPLTPPDNAKVDDVTFQPDFAINGEPFDALGEDIFIWAPPVNGENAKLIPLQPFGSIEVKWRIQGLDLQDDARISSLGAIGWPNEPCTDSLTQGCYQVHVTGAPVEAEPASGDYKVFQTIDPQSGSSNPEFNSGLYTSSRTGTGVLVYVNGPDVDPQQYPVVVEVVRSLPYTAVPNFVDNVEVEIGKKITDPFHNEPGRTGFVVNQNSYHDGHGPDAAYNRSSRTGVIIPVNRYSDARPQEAGRELAVAWYRTNSKGVYWPAKAVRYEPRWPFDPDRIIVASELGGEVLGQAPLDPAEFDSARIYVQNDFNFPGYNPNDEHAVMASSNTGSGHQAVYALRSDYGSGLEGDRGAASDPYVLVKYYDDAVLEWKFRVFRVEATGAGFTEFRYNGTAGTAVAPPFPVSLLVPGCNETFVTGQAAGEQPPPPFFQDYSNQLWAKSAGSGSVHYYYPAQPGFFVDRDKNDENDISAGDCVPWLEQLPASEGGSDSPQDPIQVAYEITWPDEPPLLVSGETLLEPKRGLPDIINQAAVEVVYDEIQETATDPLPSDTLAQLIDPLNPRFIYLDAIPSEVATQFRTDGSEAILGSADGSIKLPVSIRDRLSYDPLNDRLSVKGIYDDSGAGEPFLLLNVLSKRDRVTLKTLNGGDGSEATAYDNDCLSPDSGCDWDQAIEALFRLSRNPQGINQVCQASSLNEDRVRVCEQARPVNADDVLIGYQDDGDDGILEPFQAVGVDAALTAGLAQGDGYMTLALNNDQSLSPLPVSLEIIKVGCLRSPPPPEPPDILSTYQGQINVIAPENIFDEQLVLRHSGDFGGNPDALEFQWFYHPDTDGTPPMPVPDPDNGQLNGWFQFPLDDPQGAVEISIEGANIQTLSDNWYLARYRGLPGCQNDTNWSLWAGNPGATPTNQLAQLAEGWVKRVLNRLNPFEARVQDFAQAATNNFASMLIQLGERYEGPVALNNDPDNLNNLGLIEAYQTVMRRAMQLSVDGTPPVNYAPANNAILLVASRLVDFYTLLGNEAYADAQDPTIGITTSNGDFTLAPSIFNFQNQLASLLEEELVLLRGRDDSLGPVTANPVYNRLFWNFTTGDGEVAYTQSYNISDQNSDGIIDEFDARIMFPQGHGDAWGHYLTGTKFYYDLLRHPFYSWDPRAEAITVAGVPISVDFLDERQFAETAAAKARTGAEIVDLTYRSRYVDDPDGQWQGYDDTRPERAWGLSEWGRRSGMGAYFDWATANSILPDEDTDPTHVGIQKIDRSTVTELGEIAAQYDAIQAQVDEADAGLNPLGLADGVVSFDIDPAQLEIYNQSHFEQVANKAVESLKNAVEVWDFANELDNQMRRNQNEVDDLTVASNAQETDFSNQLIEIFGYPYPDDIGPGGVYPAGYDGPDMYHYQYIDVPALAGTAFDFDDGIDDLGINRIREFTGSYDPVPNGINFFNMTPSPSNNTHTGDNGQSCQVDPISPGCALGDVNLDDSLEVTYHTIESPDFGYWFTKPESWTGERRAPGELQQILQQMLQARISLKQALLEYDKLRQEIESEIDTLQATFDITEDNLNVTIEKRNELRNLTIAVETMRSSAIVARRVGEFVGTSFEDSATCIPDNTIAGVAAGGDLFSAGRCAVNAGGSVAQFALDTAADGLDIAANATDAAKEDVSELAGINTAINDATLDLFNAKGKIDALLRQEPVMRSEIFSRAEAIKQLVGDYKSTLARGMRVFERLTAFRKLGAAAVQEYRYQDMAFRIFRNDALQKYRAAFELAARYVYLSATAYDYETNLLGTDTQAGQQFLTNIVRQRNLGQLINGEPVTGTSGLANSVAQLRLNFDVLKGQMGFNDPQIETNRFSLREELFRIPPGSDGDAEWRQRLQSYRVDDLWSVPEFRRYARPFAPQSAGPQPGLVIPFSSNVNFGMNFFGWELGAGDSSYDSSRFATRIRSVGTWFGEYSDLPLADDPRIYLIPVGADVLRSPSPTEFETREWQVVEQAVPIPFPVESDDLETYNWLPMADTVSESPVVIRRHARFPAYHFSQPFDDTEVTSDSRLLGRSVWNRRWVMIIPGGTFLNDPVEGLDTFISGEVIPGSGGLRDGEGVNDILIFFETYSYSGN